MTWLNNTQGKPDATLTLSVISLAVVLVKFFLSEMAFGSIIFGNLDAGVVAAILTPTLASYCFRRHTDANANKDGKKDDQ